MIARFSSSTGLPALPDTQAAGNPRGLALRFMLATSPRRVHTDIVMHSVNGFPGRNGEDALGFFRALKEGTIGSYLETHPAAAAFVNTPKPTPSGLDREVYYGVNAFKFVNDEGKETFVRYRVLPVAGENYLDEDELEGKADDFLYDGVKEKLGKGPVEFRLVVQVAEDEDVTDDCTVQWPSDRQVVELGTIKLEAVLHDNDAEQKRLIFDPIPRVDGIEVSADPLLDVRAGVYLLSGRERRAA